VPCPACHGSRLNPIARHVRLQGHTIDNFTALSAAEALHLSANWFPRERQNGRRRSGAGNFTTAAVHAERGAGLSGAGTFAKTFSGGESQRIRLARQLGSNLRGVLYVLDEPTIGLHPAIICGCSKRSRPLRQKGNSLVIVEHDEETMRRADTLSIWDRARHSRRRSRGAGNAGGYREARWPPRPAAA